MESLWLSGRASERGIRRSEVRFLMGTQNFFLCPTLVTRLTKIFLYTSITFPFLKINKSFFILIISNSYCSFGQDSWILASFLFLRFSELWLVTVHKNAKKKKKKNSANIQPSWPHAWSIHIYIKSESKVNQKALGASSFMLWLKFALISWTRWI